MRRPRQTSKSRASDPLGRDGRLRTLAGRWQGRLERKAFSHLDRAIAEAGAELPRAWVESEDKDLQVLREKDDLWKAEIRELIALPVRRSERTDGERSDGERSEAKLRDREAEHRDTRREHLPDIRPPALHYSARPWLYPAVRVFGWIVLGVLCVAGFVWITSQGLAWEIVLGLVLAFCAVRVAFVLRERAWAERIEHELGKARRKPGTEPADETRRRPTRRVSRRP